MKVLHLCAGNLFGGVERIVLECARSSPLDPAVRHSFAVCFDGRLAQQLDRAGASCVRLGDVRVSRPASVFRARRRLHDLLSTDRPDVVVCHSSWMLGLAGPVLRRRGIAAAVWIHDRVSGRPWAERWASLTVPAVVICNSEFTRSSVAAVFPDVPAHVVYAPVAAPDPAETRSRAAMRDALRATDTTCVIMIASRFEAWKGQRELVDALAGVTGDWALWVAGAPQQRRERHCFETLRSRIRHHGLENRVRLLGHRDDVAALMMASDVHCQPNTAPEPFGIAFVEALHARLPVVTTGIGGATEIVTNDCGVLLPPHQPDALRDALQDLVAAPHRRRSLGAAGPARAAQLCDPARQLRSLGDALRTVTAPAPTREAVA